MLEVLQFIFSHPRVAGLLAAISILVSGHAASLLAPPVLPSSPETVPIEASIVLEQATEQSREDSLSVVNDTVYPLNAVNLRSGPSTWHDVLIVLPKDTPVQRIAIGDHGWSLIYYAGFEGYVSNGLLSAIAPTQVAVPTAPPATEPAESSVTEPTLTESAPPASPTEEPTAAPTIATTTPQFSEGYLNAAYGAELMILVNAYRVENGLPTLQYSAAKQADTDYAAREISLNGFNHTGRDNNIAMGYNSPQATLNAWINSPGHHANLLWAVSTTGAASCFVDKQGVMWWAFRN